MGKPKVHSGLQVSSGLPPDPTVSTIRSIIAKWETLSLRSTRLAARSGHIPTALDATTARRMQKTGQVFSLRFPMKCDNHFTMSCRGIAFFCGGAILARTPTDGHLEARWPDCFRLSQSEVGPPLRRPPRLAGQRLALAPARGPATGRETVFSYTGPEADIWQSETPNARASRNRFLKDGFHRAVSISPQ